MARRAIASTTSNGSRPRAVGVSPFAFRPWAIRWRNSSDWSKTCFPTLTRPRNMVWRDLYADARPRIHLGAAVARTALSYAQSHHHRDRFGAFHRRDRNAGDHFHRPHIRRRERRDPGAVRAGRVDL